MKITTTSTACVYPNYILNNDALYCNVCYPYTSSTSCNIYDDFIGSLSYDKTRAINAAYDNGYLTEDEAKQLKEHGTAYRNECTKILLYESFDGVKLHCYECITKDGVTDLTTLFKLSYDKMSGFLVDEMNIDIVN